MSYLWICQVGHRNTHLLNCDHRESGGYRCERTDVHTAHWISTHTIEHARWGNGYPCSVIEELLGAQLTLW